MDKLKPFLILAAMMAGCSTDSKKAGTNTSSGNIKSEILVKTNIENYTVDHIAIRQLIEQYNDIVNHRSWDSIGLIFSKEATWEAKNPVNLKWVGLEDIKNKLPQSVERMEILIQTTTGIIIEVENDNTAHVRSLLTEMGRNKETGEGMHSVGSYTDKIIKEDGTWKFSHRTLTLIYNDQLPVPGGVKGYKY